jgi:hypothetical protein
MMSDSAVYWIHREADEAASSSWLSCKTAERTCSVLLPLFKRSRLWLLYNVALRSNKQQQKKTVSLKRPVKNAICERYLCILWFTALLYLNGVWLYGRWIWPEVGRLYSLDVFQGMCPMETKVMGEGIDIGPNPLHPPVTSVSTWM